MGCPAESHTLDEFKSDSATYSNRQKSGLRKKLEAVGVKVYEAVQIGRGASKDEAYKARMELEKILGTNITGSAYVDSAWGCKHDCDCQGVSYSDYTDRYGMGKSGCSPVGKDCTCDKVTCSRNCSHCDYDCNDEELCPQY